MKKYARWGLVVLAAVVVIGGYFIIRQVRREKYVCSPLDSCVYQGNTLETGTIVGTPFDLRQIERGVRASMYLIYSLDIPAGSNDGAGPMNPIRPSFCGPGEDR